MNARVVLCFALALSSLPSVAHARRPEVAATPEQEAEPRAQRHYARNGQTVGPAQTLATPTTSPNESAGTTPPIESAGTNPTIETAGTTPPSATPAPTPVRDHERPTTTALDADAHADAMRLRKSGLITLMVGGSLVIIGSGIAGGYTTGVVGAKGLWAGVGIASVGLLPTIIGGVMYGVGNRRAAKLQRLTSLRVAPLASRNQAGIAVGGRF